MSPQPDGVRPVDLIRRPSPINVRSVWPSEPQDFTPWLAHNLDLLDVLEIGPLETVQVEKQIPGTYRSLDILAQTPDGRLVAIENQFAQADHDHFTRGLAYAVGLRAKALVVIAERHLDEFRAIADYLNHAADSLQHDGIAVFLVEFGVSSVEGFFVPRFEVVARPNDWSGGLPPPTPRTASTLDGFLALCAVPAAERFRSIIEDWLHRPGTRVHVAPRSVALHRANPLKPSTSDPETAAYQMQPDGTLWVNRGYLLDGGLGETEEDIAAFDDAMRRYLPGHQRTEKNFYPKVKDPDPAQVRAFSDWIDSAFARVIGRRASDEG